jgi:pimeloyl-ACP methyl ester carboxylesterase
MSQDSDEIGQRAPWLTMLHGFSQNATLFNAQKPHFGGPYRVFCPELLGHGGRSLETLDYSIPSYAKDVLSQMREQGLERTHFWGTHTGTSVGLYLAIEHPALIASLILEAPVIPGIDMPVVAAQIERARTIAQTKGVEEAMEDWFLCSDWFRVVRANPVACRAAEQRDIVRAFRGRPLLLPPASGPQLSLVDRVKQLSCPTLIYYGSDDHADFKRAAAWLAGEMAQAERVEIPALGGFPAWESPERVNRVVDYFLDEVGR